MQREILLGARVTSMDGRTGLVSRFLVNPNRRRLDYVLVKAGDPGVEHYVPVRHVSEVVTAGVEIDVPFADLAPLPREGGRGPQGTLEDNITDLCIVGEGTALRDEEGTPLGHIRGIAVNDDYEIAWMIVREDPPEVPVGTIAPCGADELMITVPDEPDYRAMLPTVAPLAPEERPDMAEPRAADDEGRDRAVGG